MPESGHDIIPVLMELSGKIHEHQAITGALGETGRKGQAALGGCNGRRENFSDETIFKLNLKKEKSCLMGARGGGRAKKVG